MLLDSFDNIVELVHAVAYNESGEERLEEYRGELIDSGRLNRNLANVIDALLGKEVGVTARTLYGTSSLDAVSPGRFQMLNVDSKEGIKAFVLSTGAEFKVGRGFYEANQDARRFRRRRKSSYATRRLAICTLAL